MSENTTTDSITFRRMVERVREQLNDTKAPYRFPTSFICESIVDGLRTLHNLRPESRYCGLKLVEMKYPDIVSPTPDNDTGLAELLDHQLHIDPRWESCIRYYAQSKCFEVDSSDTNNATKAQYCLSQFTALAKL